MIREHQKMLNLLNEPIDSKFVTRKWNIANDLSNANHGVGYEKSIIQKSWKTIFMITAILTF